MKSTDLNIQKKLSELVSGTSFPYDSAACDPVIKGIEYDSRFVSPGDMFVAVTGFVSDGHEYVKKACDAGAAAVVVSEERLSYFKDIVPAGTPLLPTSDTRAALSELSAAFFDNPSSDMVCVGITGTNGKTSFTYMMESIISQKGLRPGVIGTVNYRWAGNEYPAPNTTPESRDIQEILYRMRLSSVGCVIMEISSHALELGRVDHVSFDRAVFTNLTRDHLDFHESFENYYLAKRHLFELLALSPKKSKAALINTDDEYGSRLYDEIADMPFDIYKYGFNAEAEYSPDPDSIHNEITGLEYSIARPVPDVRISLSLAGTFHVYNSLAAFSTAHSLGYDFKTIVTGLADLGTVPGRFDVISSSDGFSVVVDYAHTVDALEKLLQSVRELNHSRIITVFGCGGDRDRTKRPLMGQAAVRLSDMVIVTSDNPRTEDPEAIIQEITTGLGSGDLRIIPDRESAIREAVSMAGSGDIIVVAGKGHEDYQIIGKEKIHFDDREIARKYIESRSIA